MRRREDEIEASVRPRGSRPLRRADRPGGRPQEGGSLVEGSRQPRRKETRRKSDRDVRKIGKRSDSKSKKKGNSTLITQLTRELQSQLSIDPLDPDYGRLRYVRYADDFLLGFAGPKNEAEAIRTEIAEFLSS